MGKLRQSARGQECLVRIPGICNGDPATVVLAHVGGAGMGRKQPDILGAFACAACHDEIDRRTRYMSPDDARLAHYEGVMRTQLYWIEAGLIGEK